MPHVANGRIVLWQGGSLWIMHVPGSPDARKRTDFHAHHAVQVTLALEGAFDLHLEDGSIPGPAAVVAADVPHAFEPRGTIAHLFVEPESAAGRVLRDALLCGRSIVSLPPAQELALKAAMNRAGAVSKMSDEDLRSLGRTLITTLAGEAAAAPSDPRIQASILWASSRLDQRLSTAAVAEEVGLSTDRMSHLFVEETGLPFRTYLLWLRLNRAVEDYAGGASLTRAAHEAGFADSAHFSRTFRRMFGLPAAELRLQ